MLTKIFVFRDSKIALRIIFKSQFIYNIAQENDLPDP